MTDARLRLWHRTGIFAAIGGLALATAAQGCSSDDTKPDTMNPAGGPTFSLASDGPSPFDATPDPDGTTIYLTGLTADGTPGVFKVPADGSAKTPVAIATGGLLTSPFGISISGDGKQLFVSDPGANLSADDAPETQGAILTVAATGGELSPVPGTESTVPRSLDVVDNDGKDVIFYSGTDKSDGAPGIFSVSAAGGEVTTVFKGDPLRDPSGVAVAADGTIYVADTVSATSSSADIIAISKSGEATKIVEGIRVGYPAGIALNKAGTTLLVSALNSETLNDTVIAVDLTKMTPTDLAPDTIKDFSEAGGLHRARNKDVFGWSDSNAGPNGGNVFLVK